MLPMGYNQAWNQLRCLLKGLYSLAEMYATSFNNLFPLESGVQNIPENLFKFFENFDRVSPYQVVKNI